jgi:hypothetical protein
MLDGLNLACVFVNTRVIESASPVLAIKLRELVLKQK